MTTREAPKSPATTALVETAVPGAALPERKYFRIGEVAEIVGVEPHVLRYWETQFSQLRPHKARSGHRLYRRREVETLLVIKDLLHVQRFTIAGARLALRQGAASTTPRPAEQLTLPPAPGVTARHTRVLESTLPGPAGDVAEDDVLDGGLDGGPDDGFDDDALADDGLDDEALDDRLADDAIDDDAQGDRADDGEGDEDEAPRDDDGDDEMELHLAGPLPPRPQQVEVEFEALDGAALNEALDAELAGQIGARRGRGVTAVSVRSGAPTSTARARRMLHEARSELEQLLAALRRR